MAKYMFDTNMCIYLMKNQPQEVAARLALCSEGDVVLSVITLAELEYGIAVSTEPDAAIAAVQELVRRLPVLPLNAEAAKAYGPIRAATRHKKSDALDKLIAAHAVSEHLILVTNNTNDFAIYPGLSLENWIPPNTR